MKFLIIIKSVYGKDLIYTACEQSRAFLQALGRKTFTDDSIKAAKICGVTLEQTFERKF